MMSKLRAAAAAFDRRDALAALGIGLLIAGGERLHPGAGLSAAGAVLVAIAVLVR